MSKRWIIEWKLESCIGISKLETNFQRILRKFIESGIEWNLRIIPAIRIEIKKILGLNNFYVVNGNLEEEEVIEFINNRT